MAGVAVMDGLQKELMTMANMRGIIVLHNATGIAVRSTITPNVANIIAHHCLKLVPLARLALEHVDPYDTIQVLRIRGKNFEYVMYLEKELTMIAIQEHTRLEEDDIPTAAQQLLQAMGNDNHNKDFRLGMNINAEDFRNKKAKHKKHGLEMDFMKVNFQPRHS